MGVAEAVIISSIVAGSAAGAAGAIQQGRAAEAEGKAQKKWNDYNAEVSRRNAKATEDAADYETRQQRREKKQIMAAQRAEFAKGGTTMEGSPLEIAEDTAGQLELDIMMNRRNRMIEAGQYKSQANLENMAGNIAKMRGKNIKQGSFWQAGSTLLTGLGTAGYYGYTMKK